jgi:hypothetical protein
MNQSRPPEYGGTFSFANAQGATCSEGAEWHALPPAVKCPQKKIFEAESRFAAAKRISTQGYNVFDQLVKA